MVVLMKGYFHDHIMWLYLISYKCSLVFMIKTFNFVKKNNNNWVKCDACIVVDNIYQPYTILSVIDRLYIYLNDYIYMIFFTKFSLMQ